MPLHNRSESGAALMIAMVLIFMISIMGASVMRNSNLEHRMASNSVQSAMVFQAAESAVEKTLNDPTSLVAAFGAVGADCVGDAISWDAQLEGNTIDGLTTESEIRFTRTSLAPGYSPDLIVSLNYITRGSSQIASARAESAVFRSASRIVPAGANCN